MEFYLDIFTTPIDTQNVISAIVQFCVESDESEFIYSLHPEGFTANDDDEKVIIIRGEYELMQGILNVAKAELERIKPNKSLNVWSGFDIGKYHLYRTAIIAAKSDFDQLELDEENPA